MQVNLASFAGELIPPSKEIAIYGPYNWRIGNYSFITLGYDNKFEVFDLANIRYFGYGNSMRSDNIRRFKERLCYPGTDLYLTGVSDFVCTNQDNYNKILAVTITTETKMIILGKNNPYSKANIKAGIYNSFFEIEMPEKLKNKAIDRYKRLLKRINKLT